MTVRHSRSSVYNRLELENLAELDRLVPAMEADPAARVLVLTASGRSFCSGFNVGKLDGTDGKSGGDGAFDQVADRMERFCLPTICALNGSVHGGSTDLALIAANQVRSRQSADLAEERAAWLEKPTPRFTGA